MERRSERGLQWRGEWVRMTDEMERRRSKGNMVYGNKRRGGGRKIRGEGTERENKRRGDGEGK